MWSDQSRSAEANAPTDDDRRALMELAAACQAMGLRVRQVEHRGRFELRIWDPSKGGAAVQVGCSLFDDSSEAGPPRLNRWFTRSGIRLALADNLGQATQAIRARVRARV